ncbi:extracellular tyrosine-protein kinase PKDCC [Lingula anatina]|uniref:Extracellular tyrosine-protein kinase PKDCC n=1 Tax=Lingula anatina TaxID=7574 RepID=A0A1S3J434_LINAN|nr:extracellular tyrosine-protein kinase PKDCC [Lingula anatina]XP_013404600.1 extracellular tyrosine-protein kinase PKDCC [Lingula anatina]|eukprot:XP_013404599.1 extracellular tyrosine-protein kinase PKDCC [Lingula anatina]
MAWKKRRRYPTSLLISTTLTIIFMASNIAFIHYGLTDESQGNEELRDVFLQDRDEIKGLGVQGESVLFSANSVSDPHLRKLMEDTRASSEDFNKGDALDLSYHSFLSTHRGLSCDDVRNFTDKEYVASGWTKAVYKVKHKGQEMALKTVDVTGRDVTTCLKNSGRTLAFCYAKAARKILKEIVLLQGLNHKNVVKVLGYCVPNKPYDGSPETEVSMVVELGTNIDIIRLLQMSWEDRLRVSYGVGQLLHYIANSPYGSLSLNDFRRQQFVLVGGEVKLSDVDDVGFEEVTCKKNSDCDVPFSSANYTIRTHCINQRCFGLNEKKNIFNAGRHFTTFILPHGVPKPLQAHVNDVIKGFSNATVNSAELSTMLDTLVHQFSSGFHLNRLDKSDYEAGYECTDGFDYPGRYDYRCRYSVAGGNCHISVFDQKEAEMLCDKDKDCKGFVMSDQKSWTGRTIVHIKNNKGLPAKNPRTRLCNKPGSH